MVSQLQQVTLLLAAQAPAGGNGGGGCPNSQIFLLASFVAIFYFIYIRPTGQDQKRRETLLQTLKRGDEVVLQSGIIGKVADISNKTVHIELARNVKMEVLKTAVVQKKADLKLSEDEKSAKPDKGEAKSSKK